MLVLTRKGGLILLLPDGTEVTKGLVIREPWISLILKQRKIWEMRSRPTNIRGRIALLKQGTGEIVGYANLTSCLEPLNPQQLIMTRSSHGVDYTLPTANRDWNTPWVLQQVTPIEPIPYSHPKGAITWVLL